MLVLTKKMVVFDAFLKMHKVNITLKHKESLQLPNIPDCRDNSKTALTKIENKTLTNRKQFLTPNQQNQKSPRPPIPFSSP